MPQYTVNPWTTRISEANKLYEEWESKFDCKRLYDYYENFQWKGRAGAGYRPYTMNLFHSTIKIKMASFLFQRPEFIVTAEPGHAHWDLDFAVQSAQLKQDVLNTIIKNPNMKFASNLKRASLDAFFRFGMIEVGYAADWRNPLKDDPYLNSWDDPEGTPEDSLRVKAQNEVPINERFYAKRIKPWRFRTSVSDAEDLDDQEWVGYWQYYYTETLKKTPGIDFPRAFDGSVYSSETVGTFSRDRDSGLFLSNRPSRPLCKIWHIWDNVSHSRKMLLGNYDNEKFCLWEQAFEHLPLIDLRWDLREEGFLPIPPAWYWMSSQDEINESREQIRSYRRRFTRKFQMVKGMVDQEEAEKFVAGPDGILVVVKQQDAIKAIDNPEIGPTSEGALIQAKEDFNIASGTSAEARPGGDRETATKSQITDARAKIRESAEQLEFTEFAALIGREILVQASEKLVDGLWMKYSSNPSETVLTDVQVNQPFFKWIKAQDLSDGYDFYVAIDVRNATPAAMEQEQKAFVNFIMFLQSAPMVAMSPLLIREAAYRFGYKNEAVIHQVQQVAVVAMAAKAANAGATGPQILGAAASGGGGGGNPADTAKAQMAQPDAATIQKQLTEQIQ